jgi:hypothetical protein
MKQNLTLDFVPNRFNPFLTPSPRFCFCETNFGVIISFMPTSSLNIPYETSVCISLLTTSATCPSHRMPIIAEDRVSSSLRNILQSSDIYSFFSQNTFLRNLFSYSRRIVCAQLLFLTLISTNFVFFCFISCHNSFPINVITSLRAFSKTCLQILFPVSTLTGLLGRQEQIQVSIPGLLSNVYLRVFIRSRGDRNVNHLHLLPKLKYMELHLYSPIRLLDVVFNEAEGQVNFYV